MTSSGSSSSSGDDPDTAAPAPGSSSKRPSKQQRLFDALDGASLVLTTASLGLSAALCALCINHTNLAWAGVLLLGFIVAAPVVVGALILARNHWLVVALRYCLSVAALQRDSGLGFANVRSRVLRCVLSGLSSCLLGLVGLVVALYLTACYVVTAVLSVPLLDVALLVSLVPWSRRRFISQDLVFLESYKPARALVAVLLQALPLAVISLLLLSAGLSSHSATPTEAAAARSTNSSSSSSSSSSTNASSNSSSSLQQHTLPAAVFSREAAAAAAAAAASVTAGSSSSNGAPAAAAAAAPAAGRLGAVGLGAGGVLPTVQVIASEEQGGDVQLTVVVPPVPGAVPPAGGSTSSSTGSTPFNAAGFPLLGLGVFSNTTGSRRQGSLRRSGYGSSSYSGHSLVVTVPSWGAICDAARQLPAPLLCAAAAVGLADAALVLALLLLGCRVARVGLARQLALTLRLKGGLRLPDYVAEEALAQMLKDGGRRLHLSNVWYWGGGGGSGSGRLPLVPRYLFPPDGGWLVPGQMCHLAAQAYSSLADSSCGGSSSSSGSNVEVLEIEHAASQDVAVLLRGGLAALPQLSAVSLNWCALGPGCLPPHLLLASTRLASLTLAARCSGAAGAPDCPLASLGIVKCQMSSTSVRAIAAGLAANSSLKSVKFSGNLGGKPAALAFAAALQANPGTLQHLNLSFNKLCPSGGDALANAIASAQPRAAAAGGSSSGRGLQRLVVQRKEVGGAGLRALVQGLRRCTGYTGKLSLRVLQQPNPGVGQGEGSGPGALEPCVVQLVELPVVFVVHEDQEVLMSESWVAPLLARLQGQQQEGSSEGVQEGGSCSEHGSGTAAAAAAADHTVITMLDNPARQQQQQQRQQMLWLTWSGKALVAAAATDGTSTASLLLLLLSAAADAADATGSDAAASSSSSSSSNHKAVLVSSFASSSSSSKPAVGGSCSGSSSGSRLKQQQQQQQQQGQGLPNADILEPERPCDSVAAALRNVEGLAVADLAGLPLGNKGVKAVASALQDASSLQQLLLQDTGVLEEGAVALAAALIKRANATARPAGAAAAAAAAAVGAAGHVASGSTPAASTTEHGRSRHHRRQLGSSSSHQQQQQQPIDRRGSRQTAGAAVAAAAAAAVDRILQQQQPACLNALQVLDLSSNTICDAGATALAAAVSSGACPQLRHLSLNDNRYPFDWSTIMQLQRLEMIQSGLRVELGAPSTCGSSSSSASSECSDDLCGVCLDAPNSLHIRSCSHQLCIDCYKQLVRTAAGGGAGSSSRQLQQLGRAGCPACPFCRTPMTGFMYSAWAEE
ncbi:hypothetical protein COO60DRAFT_1699325 [Scenedesmus sp. NREL 46B-D3]|nr:hypothetical protein COO60DRAFT_1699325 [Scenedesmus sp. NREL 46B-D3]